MSGDILITGGCSSDMIEVCNEATRLTLLINSLDLLLGVMPADKLPVKASELHRQAAAAERSLAEDDRQLLDPCAICPRNRLNTQQ